jgi:Sec-independent protein translocase protein TatA
MFNLSFGEIAVIAILAVIFIKPSDIPVILKNSKKLFNKFLDIKNATLDELKELQDEFSDIEADLLENNKIIKENKKQDIKNDAK